MTQNVVRLPDQPDGLDLDALAVLQARAEKAEAERDALRGRAQQLAATRELDGAARTYAHAGRYVLGLAGREDKA
jgi:hypothetical protein